MPELDHEALRCACFSLAQKTKCDRRPIDVGSIERMAEQLAEIAIGHASYLKSMRRDPNFVVDVVRYVERHHGLPWGDRTEWFNNFVEVLVGLACPRANATPDADTFYREIEQGIARARSMTPA